VGGFFAREKRSAPPMNPAGRRLGRFVLLRRLFRLRFAVRPDRADRGFEEVGVRVSFEIAGQFVVFEVGD